MASSGDIEVSILKLKTGWRLNPLVAQSRRLVPCHPVCGPVERSGSWLSTKKNAYPKIGIASMKTPLHLMPESIIGQLRESREERNGHSERIDCPQQRRLAVR